MLLKLEILLYKLFKGNDIRLSKSEPSPITKNQWVNADRIIIGILFIAVILISIFLA